MEFLKTLAAEAARLSPTPSEIHLHQAVPLSCALATPLDALHAAVVMEMLSDELEVLSSTVSAPRPELRTEQSIALDYMENRAKFSLLPKQRRKKREFSLVQHYSTVIPRRMLQGLGKMHYWSREDLNTLMVDARVKTDTASGKHQRDRTFVMMNAENALRELLQTGTFTRLNRTIEDEKDILRKFWNTCLIIPKGKIKIKRLKEELALVREDKWVKLKELDQEIFRLKDQHLEQDRRLQLEARLVDKEVKMIVKRFKRKHRQVVRDNNETLQLWQKKMHEEYLAHWNITTYLKASIERMNEQLTYWQDKYETDLTLLTTALEELIERRNRDIQRSNYIYSVIERHEPIYLDDLRQKRLAAEEKRMKELRIKADTKLQAWWRGLMVRRELGPFKPDLDGSKRRRSSQKSQKGTTRKSR